MSEQLALTDVDFALTGQRRENVSVTLEQPTVAHTVNGRGEPTITIKARYVAGRNVDITTIQLSEESAADLRDLLKMVLDF